MTRKKQGKRYHHGDLRHALLAETAAILRERGLAGLTLRAVARRLGVSHGAPAHHFPTRKALLTAFAAQGFSELKREVDHETQAARARSNAARLEALGRGYICFALTHPEHFSIMFRTDWLNANDPNLTLASDAVFRELLAAIGVPPAQATGRGELLAIAAWSLVHGFAALVLDGRLGHRFVTQNPSQMGAEVCRVFAQAILKTPKAAPKRLKKASKAPASRPLSRARAGGATRKPARP